MTNLPEHKLAKRDIRHEPRLHIRVTVDVVPGQMVGQQLIPTGTHELIIYESELPSARALVQTDAHKREWAACVEQHRQYLETQYGKLRKRDPITGDVDLRAWTLAVNRDTKSASAFWEERNPQIKGGRPPLSALEVLGPVQPPDTAQQRQESSDAKLQKLLDTLVQAIVANSQQQPRATK
jgi:hypothetical protein